ncbi:hypothetical protein MIZ03_0777 [Rhodoferax lithotrophicus]|uniref:Uncharacterized protein n=1 Tax=Rhodoferax lithotrophicus TaxID=2798804 RepID=A0ABN6D7M9_9BURK|nr:hypothetical protein MIZ03_0777 [Rhodoferax sp. MIZ03]
MFPARSQFPDPRSGLRVAHLRQSRQTCHTFSSTPLHAQPP